VKTNPDIYMHFGPAPTYRDDLTWERWKSPEEGGPLGWMEENAKWSSRTTIWTMPINWLNYVDQELASSSKIYTLFFRYSSMLYYGILNLGQNEFGPVTSYEILYCFSTLLISSLLQSILFGDIAGLIASRD
jgi:hypothetical protein